MDEEKANTRSARVVIAVMAASSSASRRIVRVPVESLNVLRDFFVVMQPARRLKATMGCFLEIAQKQALADDARRRLFDQPS